jgi:surface antigen
MAYQSLFCYIALYLPIYACTIDAGPSLSNEPGEPIDSLNHVVVYYNGTVNHTAGRHVAPDGYNLGLKWQCVEFVKRYYYQHLQHKMPDSYGHAKDFFDPLVNDGGLNKQRNLQQFTNGSALPPKINDLLVFDSHAFNPYGHVAIVSGVGTDYIEFIQQNPGPLGKSRERIALRKESGRYRLIHTEMLGWLRKY